MKLLANCLKIARPTQWYKNLVVFVALAFSGNLFSPALFFKEIMAFAALCLVSSGNYALNDLRDAEQDKLHPEKRHRPLATGALSKNSAILLAIALLFTGFSLAWSLGELFFASAIALFALTQAYSLYFKQIAFADVLAISSNFVVRAVAGALAISVVFSPWLVLCSFLLALFLALAKRRSDIALLGEKAATHRKVLGIYTKELLDHLLVIATTLLLAAYSIYSFSAPFKNAEMLMATIPIAMFLVFRYFHLAHQGHEIARHPELVFFDKQMLIAMLVWAAIAAFTISLGMKN